MRHPCEVGAAVRPNNLGLLLLDRGDFIGAETMFRESLAIRRQRFGDRHFSLNVSLNNLSAALREQRRYDEAAPAINEALSLTRESLGDDHTMMPTLLFSLGRLHLDRNEAAAAEAALREALAKQEATVPPTDWRLAATRSALGAALTMRGRDEEAAALLTSAGAVLRDVPGRQGREAAANRARLAQLTARRASP